MEPSAQPAVLHGAGLLDKDILSSGSSALSTTPQRLTETLIMAVVAATVAMMLAVTTTST